MGTRQLPGDRMRSERGSIPLVLLASIILGGLIVALFSVVQSGQASSGRDRDWQSAIQVADAGIQQAFVLLRDLPEGVDEPPCDTNGDGRCSGMLPSGGEYEWEYTRLGERRWEVTSLGTFGQRTRGIEANIGTSSLFPVAILGRERITYNGGGTGTDPFVVGSFGDVTLNGNPAQDSVGGIVLYGPGPHNVNVGPDTHDISQTGAIDLPNLAAEAFAPGGDCDGQPFYPTYPDGVPNPQQRGEIYCVGSISFPQGSHPLVGPEEDGDVIIYVGGAGSPSVTIGPNRRVNWGVTDPGDASELQIYVQSGPVTYSGTARVSAAIWAPDSACTSNGTPTWAGAIVCNTVTLNGNFGYDAQVASIGEGPFGINAWLEMLGVA
jgi:hypothetical protein